MGPVARLVAQLDSSAAPHDVHDSGGAAHGPLDALIFSSSFTGHSRRFTAHDQTSFLFGLGAKDPSKTVADSDTDKVEHANKQSIDMYNQVMKHHSSVDGSRKALDAAMAAHHRAMRPLCQEYLRHRSEIMGLAGAQCRAAQGRVNAEDLSTFPGPRGCLAPDTPGSLIAAPGTPVVLKEKRCEHGMKQLLCTERINTLLRGDPAPGEEMLQAQKHSAPEPGSEEHIHKHVQDNEAGETPPPNGASESANSENADKGLPEAEDVDKPPPTDSMDQEFRKWCHPSFRLNVQPISENLSRAVLAPSVEDEEPSAA